MRRNFNVEKLINNSKQANWLLLNMEQKEMVSKSVHFAYERKTK